MDSIWSARSRAVYIMLQNVYGSDPYELYAAALHNSLLMKGCNFDQDEG